MEYLLKKKREKIEAEAERIFGNDTLLKVAYVMAKMGDDSEEAIQALKKEAEDLAAEVELKMMYTYDASGNVVPVKQDTIEIKISE
jgi:hypothetical protein